jgi:Na+-driven multidrug efflux pump
MLFIIHVLPVQMTFEGRNLDVLSGITAPFIARFVAHKKISKTAAILWNLLCLGLLINIVIVAILSTPSPWRIFMNEPANTIVASFPVSWLPGFLVPLAYILHFVSLKQLLSKQPQPVPAQGEV